jgi:DNA-directed RNA polymerase subunit RPC12/RpoP
MFTVSRDCPPAAIISGTLLSCGSTKTEKTLNEFVCPYCGDCEIAELSWCVVLHPVARWTDEGTAVDYREAEVDWESDLPYGSIDKSISEEKPVYECRYCAKQFRKPSRAG